MKLIKELHPVNCSVASAAQGNSDDSNTDNVRANLLDWMAFPLPHPSYCSIPPPKRQKYYCVSCGKKKKKKKERRRRKKKEIIYISVFFLCRFHAVIKHVELELIIKFMGKKSLNVL